MRGYTPRAGDGGFGGGFEVLGLDSMMRRNSRSKGSLFERVCPRRKNRRRDSGRMRKIGRSGGRLLRYCLLLRRNCRKKNGALFSILRGLGFRG